KAKARDVGEPPGRPRLRSVAPRAHQRSAGPERGYDPPRTIPAQSQVIIVGKTWPSGEKFETMNQKTAIVSNPTRHGRRSGGPGVRAALPIAHTKLTMNRVAPTSPSSVA